MYLWQRRLVFVYTHIYIVADNALDAIADSDEGGLMVMCDTCNVWQHAQCMDVPEDDVPDHYYCEQCEPSLHVELLKSVTHFITYRIIV